MKHNTVICLKLDFDKRLDKTDVLFPAALCPHSSLTFSCACNKIISISVYTASDDLVRTIVHDTFPPGVHHLVWDGTNDDGDNVGLGSFIIRCSCDGTIQFQKIIKLNAKKVTA